jgi:DNA polymerase elongation subunit (family B)
MLLDIDHYDNKIDFSYYDKEGNTKIKSYTIDKCNSWQVATDKDKRVHPTVLNWDGRRVKSVPTQRLGKFEIMEFVENLPKEDSAEIFSDDLPKIYFMDIEVQILDGFPTAEKADSPITAICLISPNRHCIVLALQDLTLKQQNNIQIDLDEYFKSTGLKFTFTYKVFKSEYDLLYTFLDKFVKKIPIMTGWNIIKYDWLYLYNRAKKLNIDPAISSPAKKLSYGNNFPVHVGIIDYMDLYKEWDRSVSIKENFSLDAAAEAVLGTKKIKYNGTLQDLYENDFQKYIYYNIVDTALVYLIHNKLKTMNIALSLANLCKSSVYKASSPVFITEGLFFREVYKNDKVIAKDWNAPSNSSEDTQYAGAFVKEPIIGLHKAIACFDFASLYPSIMRQFNISPESFLCKVDPDWDKLKPAVLKSLTKGEKIVSRQTKEEKDKILDSHQEDKIVSVTGTVFSSKESVFKVILTRLYSERKLYKKKYFDYKMLAAEVEEKIKSL